MNETTDGYPAAGSTGPRPPQQVRSRALLEKVLTSAEQLFAEQNEGEVTMAAVAERAGVSIGGLYRRFDSKEQLLNAVRIRILQQLDADLATVLKPAVPDLRAVIALFVDAVARNVGGATSVFRLYIAQTRNELQPNDPVVTTLATAQRLLLDAASRHLDEVPRNDPISALSFTARVVLGACIQRVVASRRSPDGLTWDEWSREMTDMAVLYLTQARPVPEGAN